jgi:tetratricopeptide (TPR) repeat protein
MIQEGKQTGLPAAQLGLLWAALAGSYQVAADAEKALPAYEHALQLLATDPRAIANYATVLDNMGSLYLQYGRIAEAEKVRKRALAIRHEIGSPLEIGWSEEHLAEIALVKHRFEGCRNYRKRPSSSGTSEFRQGGCKEYPPGKPCRDCSPGIL